MGKFQLATSLADELGTSVGKASRFIDEVGAPAARDTLDEAAEGASRTVENWWKPAAVGGGLIGGGGLAWRQQNIEQAEAIASQQQDYSEAIRSIMESDLSPEQKRQMVQGLNDNAPAGNGGDGGDGDDGGLLGNDLQITLVMLVVLAFAFRYTLGDDQ